MMNNDDTLTPAEREFEAALSGLRPAGHAIDRDRLMFTAGMQAARRAQHRWQAATALATVLLAASWMIRPAAPAPGQVAESQVQLDPVALQIAIQPLPPLPDRAGAVPPEIWPPIPQAAYVHLRNRVVAEGADALPERRVSFASVQPGESAGGDRGVTYPRAFGPYRMSGGAS